MKLLWQNKFEDFDLTKTSPLYYKGAAEKEECVLNCFFFGCGLGITEMSFDAQNGQILTFGKDGNTDEYKEKHTVKHTPHHFECDDFIFGEYTISHHGEWGYACKKNDQLLWKKSLKGYLYTEIVLNQGNIVFGTSGQGGHFYSLNIDTGEIVFDFNTKGTSKFFDVNNNYYFCSTNGKNTQILKIDYNGNILENIEVEGLYYDYECLFSLCTDLLCVMTLKKKRKGNMEFFSPIFYCVQL
jgi:outer membrane protein assembly factor BamB